MPNDNLAAVEPYIPAVQDGDLARDEAYPHSDFGAELGTYTQANLETNDLLPHQSHPVDIYEQETGNTHPDGTKENPDWSVDAPADTLSTLQYSVGQQAVKILPPNPLRMQVLISNLSSTAGQTLMVGGGPANAGATSGFPIPIGTTLVLPYNGELWVSALAGSPVVAIAEFVRRTDS